MIRNVTSIDELVKDAKRIGIFGYPGAGKTTLSLKIPDKNIYHTDEYLNFSHEDRPDKIISDAQEPFVIEGNEVTRFPKRGFDFDLLILVTGSTRDDIRLNGLKGRVDKFVKEYSGPIYRFNPRGAR